MTREFHSFYPVSGECTLYIISLVKKEVWHGDWPIMYYKAVIDFSILGGQSRPSHYQATP